MPQLVYAVVAGGVKYGGASLAADIAVTAAVVGATSSYQQGKAAEAQGEFQAKLAEREAETVGEASEYEERASRIEGRQLRARQLLQFVKGGVVPGKGTPLLVAGQTRADIQKRITLQKYGYSLQGIRYKSEAKLARMMGRSKSRASRWQAGSSLLTGAYRASSINA